jgi:hypothetical protein
MKKALLYMRWVVVLAASSLAVAGEKTDGKSGEEGQPASVTGCLQSTADDHIYILKTDAKEVEVRGSTTLKDHVGTRVTASGVWLEGRSDVSGKQKASTRDRDRHLAAAAVRTVADTCNGE